MTRRCPEHSDCVTLHLIRGIQHTPCEILHADNRTDLAILPFIASPTNVILPIPARCTPTLAMLVESKADCHTIEFGPGLSAQRFFRGVLVSAALLYRGACRGEKRGIRGPVYAGRRPTRLASGWPRPGFASEIVISFL